MYDTSFWMRNSLFLSPLFFQWTLEFHLALVTATGNIYTIIFTYYTNFPLTINETNSQNFAKHSLCQDILFNPMF